VWWWVGEGGRGEGWGERVWGGGLGRRVRMPCPEGSRLVLVPLAPKASFPFEKATFDGKRVVDWSILPQELWTHFCTRPRRL